MVKQKRRKEIGRKEKIDSEKKRIKGRIGFLICKYALALQKYFAYGSYRCSYVVIPHRLFNSLSIHLTVCI